MLKTVIILGAGASVEDGAPLMRDFLDKAKDIYHRISDEQKSAFDLVFKALAKLRSVHASASIDLRNIESILSIFEMMQLLDRKAGLKPDEVKEIVPAIKKLIVATLEHRMLLKYEGSARFAPKNYDKFVSKIGKFLTTESNQGCVDFITFNYDMGLDFSLKKHGFNYLNAIDESEFDISEHESTYLLKLHGSLSWSKCEHCKNIWAIRPSQVPLNRNDPEKSFTTIGIKSNFPCKTCNKNYSYDPLIVPPTFNKGQHYGGIKHVWRKAVRKLGAAENIIVIGYSLPPSDWFFRYLYALSPTPSTWLRNFVVIDTNKAVKSRFEELLGGLTEERLSFYQKKFSQVGDLVCAYIDGDEELIKRASTKMEIVQD